MNAADQSTMWNAVVFWFIVAYWLVGISAIGYLHALLEEKKTQHIYGGAIACGMLLVVWPVFAAYVFGVYLCLIINAVIRRIRGGK